MSSLIWSVRILFHELKQKPEARLKQLQDGSPHSSASTKHSKRSSKSQHLKVLTLCEQLINVQAEAEATKTYRLHSHKRD